MGRSPRSCVYLLPVSEAVLLKAEFNPRIRHYYFATVSLILLISVVTIPLLLLWALGWGQWVCRKRYESLRCELTARHLRFCQGAPLQDGKDDSAGEHPGPDLHRQSHPAVVRPAHPQGGDGGQQLVHGSRHAAGRDRGCGRLQGAGHGGARPLRRGACPRARPGSGRCGDRRRCGHAPARHPRLDRGPAGKSFATADSGREFSG